MLDKQEVQHSYAERRMEDNLKPIHLALIRWSAEAKHDGSPKWPVSTMLGRYIELHAGAMQPGKRDPLTMPREVEFTDYAVANLRPIQRKVIFAEYVNCPFRGMSDKRNYLRKMFGLRMSETAWKNNLSKARGNVRIQFKTIGAALGLETAQAIVLADEIIEASEFC